MKKTSKVFGTVALSAVLAMGTAVPALAADKTSAGDAGYIVGSVEGDDGLPTDTIDLGDGVTTDKEYGADVDNNKQISGAKTEVGVYSSIGQLKVSVPTKMALALEMGGGEFAAPSARTQPSVEGGLINPDEYQGATEIPVSALHYRTGSGYGIENLSGLKVKVTKVQGTERDGFALKAKGTGKTAANTYTKDSKKATGSVADLCVSLLPDGLAPGNTAEVILTATGTSAPTSGNGVTPWNNAWTIDRATTTGSVENGDFVINPVVKGIVVSGSSTAVDGTIGETAITSTPAFDIVYTIGVA